MRKKYGCYDPNGHMCVGAVGSEIRGEAKRMNIKRVDAFYAKSAELWHAEFNLDDDEDYKAMVEESSSIKFCDTCLFKNSEHACLKIRKGSGYLVYT